MKKRMNSNVLYFVFIVFLFSCQETEYNDKQAPTITQVKVNQQTVAKGTEILIKLATDTTTPVTIEAEIEDDQALNQIKLEIHQADGHNHRRFHQLFDFEKIIPLSTKTHKLLQNIELPIDIVQIDYHINIEVLDKSGNTTSYVVTMGIK